MGLRRKQQIRENHLNFEIFSRKGKLSVTPPYQGGVLQHKRGNDNNITDPRIKYPILGYLGKRHALRSSLSGFIIMLHDLIRKLAAGGV